MCTGDEGKLADCRHDGWGMHDCTDGETSGVICAKVNPVQEFTTTTTARPPLPKKRIEVSVK